MVNGRFLIEKIIPRWILDSRGNPTVETDIITENGLLGRGVVPSGASTGKHEALELRDKEKSFKGKGVSKAINNVKEIIAPALKGMDVREQEEIDNKMIELDGTNNKSKLGANAILSVSLAVAKVAAMAQEIPLYQWINKLAFGKIEEKFLLPTPMSNVINGGEHAGNDLSIQEFMLLPIGMNSFSEAIMGLTEVYHTLKNVLVKKYGPIARNVGDEGGMAPPMKKSREALDALIEGMEEAGYKPRTDFVIGMDAAASEFWIEDKYHIDGTQLTAEEFIEYYIELLNDYPILSLEDPFDEEDFNSFAELAKKFGEKVQIVTDDLTVTNIERLKHAIDHGSGNCLLLKVNQIGTLTESIAAAKLSYENNWGVVVSHRSGETEDNFIADLSVGLSCGQIKTGAPTRSDRTAKYNQLLRIEEELGRKAIYTGNKFREAPMKL